ncbi:MAG TPA: hypothetical protein VGM67_16260 [Gemmatimonadaceae bacterium]|jgi:hypothetical protein
MRKVSYVVCTLFAVVIVGACSENVQALGPVRQADLCVIPAPGASPVVVRDTTAAVQTDQLIVSLRCSQSVYAASTPLRLTLRNPGPDTSFIVHCDSTAELSLEKRVGDSWIAAWNAAYPACLSSQPIVLPPGGEYETSVQLFVGANGSNVSPQFSIDTVPGIYRFVWESIVDSFTFPTWGAPIPVELRRSNEFAIVVTP